MKLTTLTLLYLLILTSVFGQRDFNNTLTDKHVQIAGTKYFLIPPAGFDAATSFQGFQQPATGSSIILIELPGPYTEISKSITSEALESKGIIVKKSKEITINGVEGRLFTAEQFAEGVGYKKYMLLFGDSTKTTIINGILPQGLKKYGEEILESVLSVVYDDALTVDPLEAVAFSINTENTKLKFAKNISGMLLYSVDGLVPTESEDKTAFFVGTSLGNFRPGQLRLMVSMDTRLLQKELIIQG